MTFNAGTSSGERWKRVSIVGDAFESKVLNSLDRPNYGTPIYGSYRSFRNAVQIGISNNPPMGYHPISIIVERGDIILEGVVDNEADKSMAGMLANQVSGVFSVTTNLVALQPDKEKEK